MDLKTFKLSLQEQTPPPRDLPRPASTLVRGQGPMGQSPRTRPNKHPTPPELGFTLIYTGSRATNATPAIGTGRASKPHSEASLPAEWEEIASALLSA